MSSFSIIGHSKRENFPILEIDTKDIKNYNTTSNIPLVSDFLILDDSYEDISNLTNKDKINIPLEEFYNYEIKGKSFSSLKKEEKEKEKVEPNNSFAQLFQLILDNQTDLKYKNVLKPYGKALFNIYKIFENKENKETHEKRYGSYYGFTTQMIKYLMIFGIYENGNRFKNQEVWDESDGNIYLLIPSFMLTDFTLFLQKNMNSKNSPLGFWNIDETESFNFNKEVKMEFFEFLKYEYRLNENDIKILKNFKETNYLKLVKISLIKDFADLELEKEKKKEIIKYKNFMPDRVFGGLILLVLAHKYKLKNDDDKTIITDEDLKKLLETVPPNIGETRLKILVGINKNLWNLINDIDLRRILNYESKFSNFKSITFNEIDTKDDEINNVNKTFQIGNAKNNFIPANGLVKKGDKLFYALINQFNPLYFSPSKIFSGLTESFKNYFGSKSGNRPKTEEEFYKQCSVTNKSDLHGLLAFDFKTIQKFCSFDSIEQASSFKTLLFDFVSKKSEPYENLKEEKLFKKK